MIKLIAADLDGTLAESKQAISPAMAEQMCGLIGKYKFAVISGGPYEQFIKQVVSKLPCAVKSTPKGACADGCLANLFLLPENGSSLYTFDIEHKGGAGWYPAYRDLLSPETKAKVMAALEGVIAEMRSARILDANAKIFGQQIEDRGGQITFSALGQEAPVDLKAPWDPDAKKRTVMADKLRALLPECAVHVGGMTSIDITRKGIDKAYAIGKIKEHLGIAQDEILFFGDALFHGGNDEPVATMGVRTEKVTKIQDTIDAFSKINQGIV